MPKPDCPECEYCCLIGLCCPAAMQHAALVEHFTAAGVPAESAEMAAASIVSAREKAQKVA